MPSHVYEIDVFGRRDYITTLLPGGDDYYLQNALVGREYVDLIFECNDDDSQCSAYRFEQDGSALSDDGELQTLVERKEELIAITGRKTVDFLQKDNLRGTLEIIHNESILSNN